VRSESLPLLRAANTYLE